MATIKWNRGALRKIRYGDSAPKVRRVLEDWGDDVASRANQMDKTGGYKVSSLPGAAKPQGRWRVSVITATAEAMAKNMHNNTLLRALHSGKPL